MAFAVPTLEEEIEMELALIRALIPGADTSPGSDYDILARTHATVVRGIHAHNAYLERQGLPTTAEADALEVHCQIRGITRAQPAQSAGKVLLTSTSDGDMQPAGTTLTHASGVTYQTTDPGTTATAAFTGKTIGEGYTDIRVPVLGGVSGFTEDMPVSIAGETNVVRLVLTSIDAIELWWPLPSSGVVVGGPIIPACGVVVPVIAVEAGKNGNQGVEDVLAVDSPVGDIEASATILDLAGGGDLETDAELRGRLLDWYADRPGAGNLADYRDWVRTTPGLRLDDAFIYPGSAGLGTVRCIPFGVSGARQIAESQTILVEEQLSAKTAFFDDVDVALFDQGAHDITLAVTVTAGAGYEPDWPSAPVLTTHGSTACTTTRLYYSGSVAGLEVGDRLLVPVALGPVTYLYQREVTEIVTGSSYVTIDPALPGIPGTSKALKSGGPLFEPVYAAIQTLFDDLGPGDTTPTASRYPAPSVAHPDVLRQSALIEAVMSPAGVMDCSITSSPAFSSGAVIPDAYERIRLVSVVITWA